MLSPNWQICQSDRLRVVTNWILDKFIRATCQSRVAYPISYRSSILSRCIGIYKARLYVDFKVILHRPVSESTLSVIIRNWDQALNVRRIFANNAQIWVQWDSEIRIDQIVVNKYWQILNFDRLWIPTKGYFIELIKSICQLRCTDIVSQLNDFDCVNVICDSTRLDRNKKVIFNEESIISTQLSVNRNWNLASNCNCILTNEAQISVQRHSEVSLYHILSHKNG